MNLIEYLKNFLPQSSSPAITEIVEWVESNKILPTPPIIKQEVIKLYAKKYSVETLVETGTYFGNTVEECKDSFQKIITIELDNSLYARAKKRFRNDDRVEVLHGDSAILLSEILRRIDGKVLFWLDAHYSGGITAFGKKQTPILEELSAIFSSKLKKPIILIDDANDFTGKEEYPTLNELRNFLRKKHPTFGCIVQNGIIRIHE